MIQFDRLLRLADFLDALPPERFDYSCWVGQRWEGKQDLSCGTTACALGWAATMPEFRALGMHLVSTPGHRYASVGIDNHDQGDDWYRAKYAAEVVFGVDSDDFRSLFIPSSYGEDRLDDDATAKEVAAHIRRFVEKRRT